MAYLEVLKACCSVSPALALQRIHRFDSIFYSAKASLSNQSPAAFVMRHSLSLASVVTCQRSRHVLMPIAAVKAMIPDLLLWVKFKGKKPVAIEIGKATVVSQALKLIKEEFSPRTDRYAVDDLVLIKLGGSEADPGDLIDSLFMGNSPQSPLIVEIGFRRIFILEVDEKLCPTTIYTERDIYTERSVACDSDVRDILEGKSSGLVKVSEPTGKILTRFEELEDDERYTVFSRYKVSLLDEVRWQQKEDQPMEIKVAWALTEYLQLQLGNEAEDLRTELIDTSAKKVVQEWEAIYSVSGNIYLFEAKHVMSLRTMEMFPSRLEKFRQLQRTLSPEYSTSEVIGVACGTSFQNLFGKKHIAWI